MVDRSVQVLDLVLEVQHLEVKEALLLLVADVELLLDLELNTFNVVRDDWGACERQSSLLQRERERERESM